MTLGVGFLIYHHVQQFNIDALKNTLKGEFKPTGKKPNVVVHAQDVGRGDRKVKTSKSSLLPNESETIWDM